MRETTTNSDSYTSENMLGAAYVSAKLNYGEVLNANIGVSMEYYQLKMDGYSSDGTTPVHLDNKTTDFSLQLMLPTTSHKNIWSASLTVARSTVRSSER